MTKYKQNAENVNDRKKRTLEDIPTTDHFKAPSFPEIVMTSETRYISILGVGAPGTNEFYRKKAFITDVASILAREVNASDSIPVIELLYWYPEDAQSVGIADFYSINPISSLRYRIMARIYDDTSMEDITHARRSAESKADVDNEELEIFTLPKQLVIQVMHLGPFANEFGTLERLGTVADVHGVRRSGPHHEIHLDPFTRSTPQDTLRTILRDPVA